MLKFSSLALALALLLPMRAHAQVAGAAVSGLDARIQNGELGGMLSVQDGATLLEGSIRLAISPGFADLGFRLGALSATDEPTTLATGVDMRIGIMSADHSSALLPLDVAFTAGVGAAFPNWKGQLVTIPIGISIGGELPFDTGLTRPSSLRVYIHPRIEHSRQVEGDCTDMSALCQRGWVYRADVGLSGDLTENSRWYVVTGFGDTRYTGTGFALGVRTAW